MDFFVTCDDQASYAANKCVHHTKDGDTPIAVALEVKGGGGSL